MPTETIFYLKCFLKRRISIVSNLFGSSIHNLLIVPWATPVRAGAMHWQPIATFKITGNAHPRQTSRRNPVD